MRQIFFHIDPFILILKCNVILNAKTLLKLVKQILYLHVCD